jgi:hypothetical protein
MQTTSKSIVKGIVACALLVLTGACSSSSSDPSGTTDGGGTGGGSDSGSPSGGACKMHPDQKTYPGGVCCPAGVAAPDGCIRAGAFDSQCTAVSLPPQAYKCSGGGPGPGLGCTGPLPACTYSTDCSASQGCNTKTKHCFEQSADCTGTPCTYSTDCPAAQHCNTAEGVCQTT